LLENRDLIRGLLNEVEKYAKEQLKNMVAPPELSNLYGIEEKYGHRKWIEQAEESILKGLQQIRWKDPVTGKTTGMKKKDLVEEKILSPTQVEKKFEQLAKNGLITDSHLEALKRLIIKPKSSDIKLVRLQEGETSKIPTSIESMFPTDQKDPFSTT
jgi:hypothetical protein